MVSVFSDRDVGADIFFAAHLDCHAARNIARHAVIVTESIQKVMPFVTGDLVFAFSIRHHLAIVLRCILAWKFRGIELNEDPGPGNGLAVVFHGSRNGGITTELVFFTAGENDADEREYK